jgi:hypothetical protein
MAITQSTIRNGNGITFTFVVDSSSDWSGVTNSTYFKDLSDGLIYFKNSSGSVVGAYDVFTGGTVTGSTTFTNGLTATTISASTYSNLPSPSITVGTSQITSGTDGKVLFQSGTTLQQDSNFSYDGTLKRLTLKAVGTTATDIPFAVQNSAGTRNNLTVNGAGLTTSNVDATSSYVWTNHFQAVRFESGSPITNVNIKTNWPFVESFYIGRSTSTTNNDASTASGIVYSHNGEFTVRNTQTGGFYGITLNCEQNLEQRVGIDTGRTGFGLGWSLRNFTNSVDVINFATNSPRVGIGWNNKGAALGAILDVKAQGTLSTDIAFRVRNSTDSQNIISVLGNGNTVFNNQTLGSTYLTIGQSGAGNSADGFLDFASSRGIRSRYGGVVQTGIRLFYNSTSRNVGFYVSSSEASGDSTIFFDGGQNIRIGQGYSNTNQPDVNATRTIQQMTGVAPTTSVADGFQQYSADITAGNAAPHFRTENGAIVKLYQETTGVTTSTLISNAGTTITDTDTFDGYTLQQVVKALRNLGILQ